MEKIHFIESLDIDLSPANYSVGYLPYNDKKKELL